MQRTLTFIGFILLFAIGVAMLASGVASGTDSYYIPSDPLANIVLIGSIVALLILTVMTGVGLAQAFGLLSKQISTPLDPEDRPQFEKNAISTLDRVGTQVEGMLKRVGYGDSPPATPYVPPYSYKATPENVDARQLTIAVSVTMLLLLAYAAYSQGQNWVEQAQQLDPILWAIGLGSVIVLIGAIGATGVGLSIWFYRTHEEQVKSAQIKEPAWPVREIVEWEQRVKAAPQMIKQITFLDLSLISLNLLLGAVLLGAIGLFVVPGLITVAEVDRQLNPPPTVVAIAPEAPVSTVPEDVQAEFDELPAGNAANGQAIFASGVPTSGAPACVICHDITTGVTTIGPSQLGIATRAGSRKPGYGPEIYIYESITRPNAFIAPGFTEGLMPETFHETLTPQDIADVIAYMMTLE